ncbi:MAG: T9SS type A sorting domain-containing protein, partial [Ignavibacteriaceae bacterium]|nr:T9SS type A sorting domain-containing protein [Ignavibacteriaceae bacterium]
SADEGISIGRRRSTNNKFYNGSIDEVAIYNGVLDAASILEHYNNGLANLAYCENVLAKSTVSNIDIFYSFAGNVKGSSVELYWETNINMNEGVFIIERNDNTLGNGSNWQEITNINIANNNYSRSFKFVDVANDAGKYSYRVKYSKGGTEIYSTQISAEVLPVDYVLYQNYPNPFNPATRIKFAVPTGSKITLEIYNQLGELIAQPLNNFFEAGSYDIDVDLSGFATGMYFYKLTSGQFTETKKMMLVK